MAEEKNPAAVALGKLGASKGGKARAEKLTPEQRSAIAKKAAEARWAKKRREDIATVRSHAGSELHIKRESNLYVGSITSSDGRTTLWETPEPVSRNDLIRELQKLGWHQTDIGDAFYAADPDWLSRE